MPERDQARHKMNTAGTIALNPCPKHSQKEAKLMILRGRYKKPVKTNAMKEPMTKDFEESQSANAPAMDAPSWMPPV